MQNQSSSCTMWLFRTVQYEDEWCMWTRHKHKLIGNQSVLMPLHQKRLRNYAAKDKLCITWHLCLQSCLQSPFSPLLSCDLFYHCSVLPSTQRFHLQQIHIAAITSPEITINKPISISDLHVHGMPSHQSCNATLHSGACQVSWQLNHFCDLCVFAQCYCKTK